MVVHKVVCSPLCCFLFLLINLQLMRKMSDYSNMLMICPWLACWTKQIRHDLAFLTHTKALATWCCSSQLEINVAKIKELIMCTKRDVICKPISLESQ